MKCCEYGLRRATEDKTSIVACFFAHFKLSKFFFCLNWAHYLIANLFSSKQKKELNQLILNHLGQNLRRLKNLLAFVFSRKKNFSAKLEFLKYNILNFSLYHSSCGCMFTVSLFALSDMCGTLKYGALGWTIFLAITWGQCYKTVCVHIFVLR